MLLVLALHQGMGHRNAAVPEVMEGAKHWPPSADFLGKRPILLEGCKNRSGIWKHQKIKDVSVLKPWWSGKLTAPIKKYNPLILIEVNIFVLNSLPSDTDNFCPEILKLRISLAS